MSIKNGNVSDGINNPMTMKSVIDLIYDHIMSDPDVVLSLTDDEVDCELALMGLDTDGLAGFTEEFVRTRRELNVSVKKSNRQCEAVLDACESDQTGTIESLLLTRMGGKRLSRDDRRKIIEEVKAPIKPNIFVIGVGGAGGNALNNMMASRLHGIEFIAANTDAQALANSRTDRVIQLGLSITQGLGAGSRPDIGRAAAEESATDIMAQMAGAHMVFITAGMGGGTGTGAAPVIARLARERGILTVGVVTKPFHFEGARRMKIAEAGIEELSEYVDTLLVIPNQNLFRVATERTTFADAFRMADEVLYGGVRSITDLMLLPGLINLDFSDIRTVMSEMGRAMLGTGEAEGGNRAIEAAEAAISNPLLDDTSMKGAKGVLINITGGADMTLFEIDEAANRIRDEVDQDANIIFGSTFDETMRGVMRVSVVATGMGDEIFRMPKPTASQPNTRLSPTETSVGGVVAPNVVALRRSTGPADSSSDAQWSGAGLVAVARASVAAQCAQPMVAPSSPEMPELGAAEEGNIERVCERVEVRRSSLFERLLGIGKPCHEPKTPLTLSERKADDLDIPAFLRRQAN